MTDGERMVWAATYAAGWYQSTGAGPGLITQARFAMRHARLAVEQLRMTLDDDTSPDRSPSRLDPDQRDLRLLREMLAPSRRPPRSEGT